MCRTDSMDREGEEALPRQQQQRHPQLEWKNRPMPTKEMIKGAMFAQSLQRRLRKLQRRRTSEPSELAGEEAADLHGQVAKDDLFALSLGQEEEAKGEMSFMLGRFLSGSDPSLCSTAMSNYSSDSSSSSSNSSNSVVEEKCEEEVLGHVDSAIMPMEEEGVEEEGEKLEKSKMLGSISSGYCSEPDVLSAVCAGDFLEPQQWVDRHFDGSNCSLEEEVGSGISTPIVVPNHASSSSSFGRDTSPAFDNCVTDSTDDGVLSSTPRADDYLSAAFASRPAAEARMEEKKKTEREETSPEKESEFMTITSGDDKHRVATSKLNALISLLDSSSPGSSLKKSTLKKNKDDKLFDSAPDLMARDFSAGIGAPIDIIIGGDGDGPRSLVTDEELRAQKPNKMRRASSLRSGKTPPGTPGTRKMVRFADVLGLDLADVKHFLDDVPKVPKSAYDDLECEPPGEWSDSDDVKQNKPENSPAEAFKAFSMAMSPRGGGASTLTAPRSMDNLVPMFAQPGSQPDVHDVLRERKVCLDHAHSPHPGVVVGACWVTNLGFEKSVSVRYTLDEWATTSDIDCNYVKGSCDGFSDRFAFELRFPPVAAGRRLQFCLHFEAPGTGDFWDSNGGNNYVFQCVSGSPLHVPSSSSSHPTGPKSMTEDPWFNATHHF